jgi:hypothetical protein
MMIFLAPPNVHQRGWAAHLRQMDENYRNSGPVAPQQHLTSADRHFVNKVIHDSNMNHSPHYDANLRRLQQHYFPSNPYQYPPPPPRPPFQIQGVFDFTHPPPQFPPQLPPQFPTYPPPSFFWKQE